MAGLRGRFAPPRARVADAPRSRARLAANPGPPVAKNKRAPKPGPKTVFIPKWKQAKLEKLPEAERKAKLEAFKARWFAAAA